MGLIKLVVFSVFRAVIKKRKLTLEINSYKTRNTKKPTETKKTRLIKLIPFVRLN